MPTSTPLPPEEASLDVPSKALTGPHEGPILTATRLREFEATLRRWVARRRAHRERLEPRRTTPVQQRSL